MDRDRIIKELSVYFKSRKDIAFAYLFGSLANNRFHSESDIDIGVYFIPKTHGLEYESDIEYAGESEIWTDIEKITKIQTDLVVLNRVPSTIAYACMQEGIPLSINNEGLKTRMYLALSSAAEDYREFVDDFYKIRERSK